MTICPEGYVASICNEVAHEGVADAWRRRCCPILDGSTVGSSIAIDVDCQTLAPHMLWRPIGTIGRNMMCLPFRRPSGMELSEMEVLAFGRWRGRHAP